MYSIGPLTVAPGERAQGLIPVGTSSYGVELGIPLIVEATLGGTRHTEKKDPEAIQHMCRMAYELGADAIKTEFTGDVESMRQVRRVGDGIPLSALAD